MLVHFPSRGDRDAQYGAMSHDHQHSRGSTYLGTKRLSQTDKGVPIRGKADPGQKSESCSKSLLA